MAINILERTEEGFQKDCGTHVLVWDNKGAYTGQWQDSVGNGNPIFIKPDPANPACESLTEDEMRTAFDSGSMYELVREQKLDDTYFDNLIDNEEASGFFRHNR